MDTLGLFYVNVKTSLEVNSRIAQYTINAANNTQ